MKLVHRILAALGLVTLARHREACERAKGVCDTFERMAEAAEREMERRATIAAEYDAMTPAERADLAAFRAVRAAGYALSTWTPADLATLRNFTRSPVGAKYLAQLADLAAQTHAGAVSCAHGTAERRVGYSHGFQEATHAITNLTALLDREPAEQPDDDAPSGGGDRA
ncbi:MAG: hypothetical protein RL077_354 [Verrucomicrobiota bacterium]|jgi:hypothetical protein